MHGPMKNPHTLSITQATTHRHTTLANTHARKHVDLMLIDVCVCACVCDSNCQFRKTAFNFHYEFNIRHMAGVFQGMLMSRPEQVNDALKLAQLWLHESERTYCDRLVNFMCVGGGLSNPRPTLTPISKPSIDLTSHGRTAPSFHVAGTKKSTRSSPPSKRRRHASLTS